MGFTRDYLFERLFDDLRGVPRFLDVARRACDRAFLEAVGGGDVRGALVRAASGRVSQEALDEGVWIAASHNDEYMTFMLMSFGGDEQIELNALLNYWSEQGDVSMMAEIVEEGGNVYNSNCLAMFNAACNGHLKAMDYLHGQGVGLSETFDNARIRHMRKNKLATPEVFRFIEQAKIQPALELY